MADKTGRRTPEPAGARSAHPGAHGPSDEWVIIAEVVGAFGIHGEIKIRSLTDIPDRFAQIERVYIRHRPFRVRGTRTVQRGILLQLEGIDDPEAVDKLRGAAIEIPIAEIAPLPEGQYYIHDLIGLKVQTVQGQVLGHLREVIETGSNDVYVVARQEKDEVLVPAIKDVVKEIDLHTGRMVIDPIPGLFDTTEED